MLLLAIGYWGCSVSKDFSFGIDKEFSATNFNSLTYSIADVVDAKQSSSDFDKYKGDLSSLDITSASYLISYFSGPANQNIVSGTLSVGDAAGTTQKVLATFSNINLLSVAAKTQAMTLTADGKQFFKDQLMGSLGSAKLYFTATTNQTPITFTVKFHFDISATYKTTVP